MKSQIKKQWLAALRSGQYQQARSCLRSPEGYCCLGVLCDVVAPQGWQSRGERFFQDGELMYLPRGIQEATGLAYLPVIELPNDRPLRTDPRFPASCTGNKFVSLSGLNDAGVPFSEIADLVEAYIPETD